MNVVGGGYDGLILPLVRKLGQILWAGFIFRKNTNSKSKRCIQSTWQQGSLWEVTLWFKNVANYYLGNTFCFLRAPFKLMTYLLLQEPNNVITWTCSCWQFVRGYLKYFSLSLKKTFFILLLVIFLICNSLEFYAFFEHIFWNVRFSLEVKRIALAGSSHFWRFLRC